MVSPYVPNQPLSTCHRCGTPIVPGETRCRTCGYEHNSPQHVPEQQQPKGLLSRYGMSPNQYSSNMDQGQHNSTFPSSSVQGLQNGPFEQNRQYNPFPPSVPQRMLTQEQPITTQKKRLKTGMIVGIALLLVALVGSGVLGYFYFTGKSDNARSVKAAPQSPSPIPTNLATSQPSQPLFSDDFTDNAHQWSLQSYPGQFSVSIQGGALALESDNNKLLWELVPGNQKYSDFQLSVDAVLSKGAAGNGYGIYIRSSLDQNGALATYYRFELYGDGTFAVFKSGADANAVPTRLVNYTATPAIQKQGAVNHITILAQGQKLQFRVNGYVLCTISDTSYASGTIALFVSNLQSAPAGTQAQFSHLAIHPVQ